MTLPQRKRTPSEEREYCHKAAKKIMLLCTPVKNLSVSKLVLLKSTQLDQIGKAMRDLYEILDEAGQVNHGNKQGQ